MLQRCRLRHDLWDGFDASEPIAQWRQQLDHKHHIDTDAVLKAMGQVLFGNRS